MAATKKTGGGATAKGTRAQSTADQAADNDLVIDVHELTRGETIELEEITGKPLRELFPDEGDPTALCATALVFIRLRQNNPSLTFDAVKAMPISMEFETRGAPARPTKAARRTTKR
jgi:hypothetical protein